MYAWGLPRRKGRYFQMAKKKSTFWQDFKKFITRGNVVDMAVGVVVGGAFSKIVTGLVNYVINPFCGIFIKAGDLDDIKTIITPAADAILDEAGNEITPAVAEVAILWGTWFQTIADFLIVAFCIFVVLRILMRAKDRVEAKQKAEEAEKTAAEAAAKAEADAKAAAAAAEAKAAEDAKMAEFKKSIMRQETLLEELVTIMKNK